MNKEFQIHYKANAVDHVATGVKIIVAKNCDAALQMVNDFLVKDNLQVVELTCSIY